MKTYWIISSLFLSPILGNAATINGRVTINGLGTGLSDVKVLIIGFGVPHRDSATTESGGYFSITQAPVGYYEIIASKPGFETRSNWKNLEFENGIYKVDDIWLNHVPTSVIKDMHTHGNNSVIKTKMLGDGKASEAFDFTGRIIGIKPKTANGSYIFPVK
jgi:hypothetical protein